MKTLFDFKKKPFIIQYIISTVLLSVNPGFKVYIVY